MFDWIHALPICAAKVGAVILFGSVIIFTWTLPKEFIYIDAPDRSLWRDLRIWATLLVGFQIVIYFIF